ncbi:MAG TPA: NlpC/P60 family protein [Pelobium sp.]|nr:NlpC/P60 family protein [Pelobium sp.]
MKKNLFRLFIVGILFFVVRACDYVPNRSNIIKANRSLIDTGVRYIIVQRDTNKPDTNKTKDTLLANKPDSLVVTTQPDSIAPPAQPIVKVSATINAKATELVNYAKTLIGKPYAYANTPEMGFSNSGFVNYIFSHFDIKVPKYAPAFITIGQQVSPEDVSEGDIVLFAKEDSVKRAVYQIGIVVSAKGSPVSFIHASAGKMNGVGISVLSAYYQRKVMGFRRVF